MVFLWRTASGKWGTNLANGGQIWQMAKKFDKWGPNLANGGQIWKMADKFGKW
jgi:hypothetical protein